MREKPLASDEKVVAISSPPQYNAHPLLLYFLDPDTEQRYFNFQYVDNAFIPGKVFSFMWVGVAFAAFILLTDPTHDNASHTASAFSDPWWFSVYISSAINAVLWAGLFVDSLRPYRELLHLLQIVVGWPTLIIVFLIVRRPNAFNYTQVIGCSFFSMMIVQCRLCRALPVVTLWPLLCLLVITFATPSYWPDHTKIEMLYWAIFLLPLCLLFLLERRTRRSFMERELAQEAIAESEHKTAMTQQMIVRYFPATPTRDLLHDAAGRRSKPYPDTVIVVTDIAGFTAFTSRSDPGDVIAMVTSMFHAFDTTAEFHGVEKVATVGDSYCGALFPGVCDSADRCVNAVQFACASLGFAGSSLELRVGVHLGDVVGMFVGRAPPKFDLFGPGIDHARRLEESGRPNHVHVSHAVEEAVGSFGDVTSWERTDMGFLCCDLETQRPCSTADSTNLPAPDATKVVEVLCHIAGIDALIKGPLNFQDMDTHSSASGANDEVPDDFHFLLLVFKDPSLEQRYQLSIKRSIINEYCAKLFVAVSFGLCVAQLNLQCKTKQDQGVASAIAGILALLCAYIQFAGTNHAAHTAVTFAAYNAILVLSFLGFTAECGELKLQEKYVSDIAGCYSCVAIFACQYCLDVRLVYRCLLTVATCVIVLVCIIIRRNTYRDEVTPIDPIAFCGLVFVVMSFFPDFSLRSAFRSKVQLGKLRAAAKSRSAIMANSALSIMLPTFATDRIVTHSRENRNEAGPWEDSAVASSTGDVSIDFNTVAATWEYSHAVVMFAKFHSDDPAFTPEVINSTVQAIEELVKPHDVMKVKTIGSTVMLVGGIDDPRMRQEHVASVVDAAIMVRGYVFQDMQVPDLHFRIGIHCGPCFGAVIGGNGAIFDLFGDTVNTASRMMSTANSGTIQLSSQVHTLLLSRLQGVVEVRAGVNVKGIDDCDVYVIDSMVGPEQLTQFVNFAGFLMSGSSSHPTKPSDKPTDDLDDEDAVPHSHQLRSACSTSAYTSSEGSASSDLATRRVRLESPKAAFQESISDSDDY